MRDGEKVNILLVDDQPAKLLSYEAILRDIGANLVRASSMRQALEHLLRMEIAVVLMDVCKPELDGFELAAMIRDHPRFRKTAIIFISAIHLTDVDRLSSHEIDAVDYVPVPIIPDVLRAKVKVFAELYRKSRQLEQLSAELERRAAERTAELERSNRRLQDSEDRRNLALAAGKMGSWDWDLVQGSCVWDGGQRQIFGVDSASFDVTLFNVCKLVNRSDWKLLCRLLKRARRDGGSYQAEFRVRHPNGTLRWCFGTAVASKDAAGRISRIRGVTMDITERKEAEERQSLLAREVDHRTKNALAVVHAIVSLTRAEDIAQFSAAVEGRIQALARAHNLLSESRWRGARIADLIQGELAPYRAPHLERVRISGKNLSLHPSAVQALALTFHELATNAAKHGALSVPYGSIQVTWELHDDRLELRWIESGGPPFEPKAQGGFGIRLIKAGVETQLSGTVEFEWRHDGLRCEIRVPSCPKIELFNTFWDSVQNSGTRYSDLFDAGPRRRIPLVKDESLIGLMINQTTENSTSRW
jgi:two-component sensor histidine kinase/CheY-like chemotaxis protein